MTHYLIISCLAIFSIFIHGYQFGVSDQEIFIPYILKWQDPILFKDDILFNQSSSTTSIFYPLFGFFSKFIDIQILFFAGFVIFQFIFFAAIFRLSKTLINTSVARGDSSLFAYLSLLPFMLSKFIGGTATSTFETFFGYRSLGILFLLFYLIYLMERQFLKSAVVAGLGFLVHPLSIIPSLLLLPFATLAISKGKLQELAKISLVFIILISPLILVILSQNSFSTSGLKDQFWFSIIKYRDNYLFASTWSFRSWLAFFMYIVLIGLFLGNLKQTRKFILLTVMVSLSVFVTNFIILEIWRIPAIAQFQLVRSITPLAYIGLSLAPIFLLSKNLPLRMSGIVAFLSLSLNLFGLFLLSVIFYFAAALFFKKPQTFNLSKNFCYILFATFFVSYLFLNLGSLTNISGRLEFPKSSSDWTSLQIWVKNNTPKDSLFLVPPHQTGFRIFSHRSIIGDIKDGAIVMYSPNYAKYWLSLVEDLLNYDKLNEEQFKLLHSKYNFDYVVTLSSQKLNLKQVYKNDNFIIYER